MSHCKSSFVPTTMLTASALLDDFASEGWADWARIRRSIQDKVRSTTSENVHRCPCMRKFHRRDSEGVKYFLAIPGYSKKDVSVKWADDEVVVTLAELDKEENPWFCKSCKTSYRLPLSSSEVDLKKISIKVANGMFVLHAPYREDKAPFEIEVK